MRITKAIFTLTVASSLLNVGPTVKAQPYLPITSGTFYNNVSYADVYQFNVGTSSPGAEFNGSEIAISGGQVVAWDVIDTDAAAIGGANPINATTVEISSFGATAFTPGTPNTLVMNGGVNYPSGLSGILTYVEGFQVFDGIISYNANTFTGAFDISNQFGIYGNGQYSCAAQFSGIGGPSGIMADEITSYYTSINNYVSTVDDPQGGWTFAGSYAVPDTTDTFELLLAAACLAEAGRRRFFAQPVPN